MTPLNSTLTIPDVKLHIKAKLSVAGKEYLRFQINGQSSQADNCVKSRIMNKVVDYILSIDTFEQQFVLTKDMLQSMHLKDHMKSIGTDQSLSNSASFEHHFLNNIKNMYQHSGQCDDQQEFNYVIEDTMVSNP